MADKNRKLLIPPQNGMLQNFVTRLKLITRLMSDRRVSFFLKLLPVASLVYLFSPVDAIPIPFIGALDDAAILWIGSTLFVELCPPKLVKEHQAEIESNLDDDDSGDVVDAESTDVNE